MTLRARAGRPEIRPEIRPGTPDSESKSCYSSYIDETSLRPAVTLATRHGNPRQGSD